MTMMIKTPDDDDHDGGAPYTIWFEMPAPTPANPREPHKGNAPWGAYIMIQLNSVEIDRIIKRKECGGLFPTHPTDYIIPADLNGNQANVVNRAEIGGRKYPADDVRGGPAHRNPGFGWDPELIRSWRIREFPHRPARESRWSGRILLCVRNAQELVTFPGLGVLHRDLVVNWFITNPWGWMSLLSDPFNRKWREGAKRSFNDLDERSPADVLRQIWSWGERARAFETPHDISVVGGGRSMSSNEEEILLGSEGREHHEGVRHDGLSTRIVHCLHYEHCDTLWLEGQKTKGEDRTIRDSSFYKTKEKLWRCLISGISFVFCAVAFNTMLLGVAVIFAASTSS